MAEVLHAKGWAAPSWSEAFGGPGWDSIQQHIFREKAYRAWAPTIILQGLTNFLHLNYDFETRRSLANSRLGFSAENWKRFAVGGRRPEQPTRE